jgi:predicted nucleotidyltransferase
VTRRVQDGFEELLEKVTPLSGDSVRAEKNLQAIENCLKTDFNMEYLATYGSTSHGTSIKDHSDVDCFAVIPRSNLFESVDKSLNVLAGALIKHFPETIITDGRPTVAIPFGTGKAEKHQIIPAYPAGEKNEYELYGVPAPSDVWINVSPGAHSSWMGKINDNLGKNLKPFVRLIKAWNCYNGAPLWSHYTELCVAEFLNTESSIVYAMDIKNFFQFMVKKNLEPIEGSAGSDGLVYGTSIATREVARVKLALAAEHAAEAHKNEVKGDVAAAFYLWRKLYNWQFPAY